ncbi:MAG: hypothetical protein A2033_09620 [Bacteroidetes bacterium GWA2_31_9]|nr:MAG: hypothetical protein A2033_09620 [Bacteroidetes bacterium GWA2_31_9]
MPYYKFIPKNSKLLKIKEEISISINKANVFGIIVFAISSIIFFSHFILIWDFKLLIIGLERFVFNLLITIPIFILSIIFHEVLHALIILFLGKINIKFIKAGFKVNLGIPYIHCTKPISSFTYKLSLLTPLITLGIIPLLYSFYSGNSWFLIYSIIFITGSSGDLFIFLKIRNIKNNVKILDHEELPGCYILE